MRDDLFGAAARRTARACRRARCGRWSWDGGGGGVVERTEGGYGDVGGLRGEEMRCVHVVVRCYFVI